MIGVIIKPEEQELACEFFELFKTPWEFYRNDGRYEVVVIARENVVAADITARLVVIYAGHEHAIDREQLNAIASHRKNGMLIHEGVQFPVYGSLVTFSEPSTSFMKHQDSDQAAGVLCKSESHIVARLGYDLFNEVRVLLTIGQPPENAHIPTLEIHIAALRKLIIDAGIAFVEIPPIPEGYAFVACLTHDVDHPSVRQHKCDHTMFGFIYRAVIGSIFGVLNGRLPIRHLFINLMAVAKLPFIHLSLAKDFWLNFGPYLEIEHNLSSTFFVLPFKGTPGTAGVGRAPRKRASRYAAVDIADSLQSLVLAGCEIGLHGIDAWTDVSSGQKEREEIARITGLEDMGVRMHWLFFDANSPIVMEKAGFVYDSTVGYNETVGYRAGTTQVYKLLPATKLLELPLHIMDTALFYPSHLNLTFQNAEQRINLLIKQMLKFGGALTINWHDRSVAPERLWGEFYAKLISELKTRGAWCTGAGRTVRWFQKRRSVQFRTVARTVEITMPKVLEKCVDQSPGLKVRVYNLNAPADSSRAYIDVPLTMTRTISLSEDRSLACQ